jgi:hypothetical protein
MSQRCVILVSLFHRIRGSVMHDFIQFFSSYSDFEAHCVCHLRLLVCVCKACLLNDTFGRSQYTGKGRLIDTYWLGKIWNDAFVVWGTFPKFTWRGQGNHETLIRLNTKNECQQVGAWRLVTYLSRIKKVVWLLSLRTLRWWVVISVSVFLIRCPCMRMGPSAVWGLNEYPVDTLSGWILNQNGPGS